MVTSCCIEGCSNNSNSVKNNSTAISFHAFPTKVDLRQKWLRAIGRPYWNPPRHIRICSAHFDVHEMNHDGTKARIKGLACPGGKLPLTNLISASDVKVCRICLASDVRLFSLEHGQLKVCMEVLTELYDKNQTAFDLPQFVCCECGSQLLKYNRLIEKSLIAQATLLDIFADNGRITKRLIQQVNRKALNLHSTLNYSQPAPVITVDREAGVIVEEPPKSNEPNNDSKFCVFKHQIKNSNDYLNQEPTKNQNTEKTSLINQSTKQIDLTNEVNLNIKSEEESNAYSEHYDIDNLDLKTDISDSVYLDDQTIEEEIKVEVSKQGKVENVADNVKRAVKAPQRKLASKPKRPEYCDVKKPAKDDLQGILDEMEKVLGSSDESDENSDDAAVNTGALSDSSDGECLQSLQNQPKIKKMAEDYLAKLDKQFEKKAAAKKVKVKSRSRQEKSFDQALQKLHLFKIVDLPLDEQIVAWKEENVQPIQMSKFECKICIRKFVRKKAFDKHVRRHDASRGPFECQVCKERFANMLRLGLHTARYHEKKYECIMCPKVLHCLDKAQRHGLFHSGQVYACPHCEFNTTRRSTAWEHVRSQHEHAHHCARCGHTFINAKGLITHQSMTHQGETSEPQEPHPCEDCNFVFHSESALNVHLLVSKRHQGVDIRPNAGQSKTCKHCGSQFPHANALARHVKKVHKEVECNTSRRRTKTPRAVRAVKDDKPYPLPCEHCGKELASRFEHWCHVRREHPEHRHAYRGRVSAVCATCGKCFSTKSMLHVHELRHRGPASFGCGECPRKFYDPYALRRHAAVHAPERPFPCDVCGRAFTAKGNMQKHRRMHTGETPYTCRYCGKKFRYWESLSLHEKHMHQKVPWPARDRTRGKRAQAKAVETAED